MNPRSVFLSLGFLMAWFLLLPLLVVGGGIALLAYALIAELTAVLTGNPGKSLDSSAAREIAGRMCSGYAARLRSAPRQPSL
jgi:hypothetical protein